MAGKDTLKRQQSDAVNTVRNLTNVLGSTESPKIAREARDGILEHVEKAVRAIEIIGSEEGKE